MALPLTFDSWKIGPAALDAPEDEELVSCHGNCGILHRPEEIITTSDGLRLCAECRKGAEL